MTASYHDRLEARYVAEIARRGGETSIFTTPYGKGRSKGHDIHLSSGAEQSLRYAYGPTLVSLTGVGVKVHKSAGAAARSAVRAYEGTVP